MSRSFSIRVLNFDTLCHSEPRCTLQSQLSAIRMRVITRHSWLLRSTRACRRSFLARTRASTRSQGNFCRGNEASDFAEARNDFPSRSFRMSIYRVALQIVKLTFERRRRACTPCNRMNSENRWTVVTSCYRINAKLIYQNTMRTQDQNYWNKSITRIDCVR